MRLLQSGNNSVIRLDVIDDGQGVPESLQLVVVFAVGDGAQGRYRSGSVLSQQIASAHGGLLTFEALDAWQPV